MIDGEAKNCYYFAVKNLSETYSLGWLRDKEEAIINGDNYFQNTMNNALNYQSIERDPQRISKIKKYISKYNWEEIEFPAGSKDGKKFEQNNKTTALNVLFVPHNTETIRVTCRSEYNHKHNDKVHLLMITDGNKWHYYDLESLLKKEQSCQNNPEKSYTEKEANYDPSGWAMLTKCSFDKTEDKLDYYRGKDCIEKMCKKLKERAMKIINYEEKEMTTLTDEENKCNEEQEAYHIC